jgi:hypothetical protein
MTMPTQPSKPQAGSAAPEPATGSRRGPGSPRPQTRDAGRPRGGLGAVARQFAGPSGPAGHLVTWLLARGNASFNRWLVREVAAAVPAPPTVIELGCGPGIALAELLGAYPAARVIGADPSAVVLTSAAPQRARPRRGPPDPGDRRYRPGGRVCARRPRPGLPRPVLLAGPRG